VASYYYYPGWNEGCAALGFQANLKAYNALPEAYRYALQAATAEANTWMQARYDALNPAALKRLVQGGAVLRPFTQPVLDACFKANQELMAEASARSAPFKRMYEHMLAFQRDQVAWFRVAEDSFDSFVGRQKI
jgi:TRAP-type mannitol/chloroaromatic compound transport system substrate-binding protein